MILRFSYGKDKYPLSVPNLIKIFDHDCGYTESGCFKRGKYITIFENQVKKFLELIIHVCAKWYGLHVALITWPGS